jgi:hypothetical protein
VAQPTDAFCGSCGSPLARADAAGTGSTTGAASPAPAPPTVSAASPPPQGDDRLESVYQRVGAAFRDGGIKFVENAENHLYTALFGSTAVNVKVTPAGENDTWVQYVAPVVLGARLGPDLYEYLIRKNAEWAATQFCVNPSGEILLAYALPGSIIDDDWCRQALAFVAVNADQQDDEIRARWGGKSAQEAIVG